MTVSEPCPVCHHPDHRRRRCDKRDTDRLGDFLCACVGVSVDDTDHHDQDDTGYLATNDRYGLMFSEDGRPALYDRATFAPDAPRKPIALLTIMSERDVYGLLAAANAGAAAVEARDKDWHDAIAQVRADTSIVGSHAAYALNEVLRLMEGK